MAISVSLRANLGRSDPYLAMTLLELDLKVGTRLPQIDAASSGTA
jgi:hypothetical protein